MNIERLTHMLSDWWIYLRNDSHISRPTWTLLLFVFLHRIFLLLIWIGLYIYIQIKTKTDSCPEKWKHKFQNNHIFLSKFAIFSKRRKREKIMFTVGFEPTHREKSIFKSSALLTELQRLDYENFGQMSESLCIKLIKIALS